MGTDVVQLEAQGQEMADKSRQAHVKEDAAKRASPSQIWPSSHCAVGLSAEKEVRMPASAWLQDSE